MTEQHQQLAQDLLPHLTLELEQAVESEEHPNTPSTSAFHARRAKSVHLRGRQHSQRDGSAQLGDVSGLPELLTQSHQGHAERMAAEAKSLKTTPTKTPGKCSLQRGLKKSHLSCVVKISKKPLVRMRSSILTKGIDTLERQKTTIRPLWRGGRDASGPVEGAGVYLSLCRLSLKMLSNVSANCPRAASSFWICIRWWNKAWEEKCTCTQAADAEVTPYLWSPSIPSIH